MYQTLHLILHDDTMQCFVVCGRPNRKLTKVIFSNKIGVRKFCEGSLFIIGNFRVIDM